MTSTQRLPRRDATAAPPPALRSLFNALARFAGPVPLAELDRLLRATSVSSEDLGDTIQVDSGAYVRTLVFETDNVEVLVMAWLPGQRSPIHDHAGSACGVLVVSGSADERLYRLRPDGSVEPTEDRHLRRGDVTVAFDADIHSVANAAAPPAPLRDVLVTLHVYSPPLAPTRKYPEPLATAR